MTINITTLTEVDELHCQYPGQTEPQDCFLELDPKAGDVRCWYRGDVGNAVPMAVHHRRLLRWGIPVLRADAANRLMADLVPLLARVVDGYDTRWDGSNIVGVLDEDATQAEEAIRAACEADWPEDAIVHVTDAADWYAPLGSRKQQAHELGITPDTTDAQIDELVAREEGALPAGAILRGVRAYLEGLRADAA